MHRPIRSQVCRFNFHSFLRKLIVQSLFTINTATILSPKSNRKLRLEASNTNDLTSLTLTNYHILVDQMELKADLSGKLIDKCEHSVKELSEAGYGIQDM